MEFNPQAIPRQAFGGVSRYARMASTILRSGIVPLRLDRGVELLPSLLRYGTTIAGLYAGAAAAVGDRPAVIDDHGLLTFRELDDRARRLSAALSERYGVGPGDSVGLLARNHAGFVVTLLACGRIGAHSILLNTGMSSAQAAVVADQQGLQLIVVDPDLRHLLGDVPDAVPQLLCGDRPVAEDMPATADLQDLDVDGPLPAPPSEAGRTVVMTSGTTGAPKGARRPSSGGPDALAAILSKLPIRADEAVFIAPPLFHTWGLANLQMAGAMRSTVVLRRRFDPVSTMADVSAHRCSTMAVVPVMLQRILEVEADDRPERRLADLRVVACSGSALPGPLATRWMDAYGDNLFNLYGSTEVSWATIATPEDLRASPGTAGKPPMGTVLRILDDDGNDAEPGTTGRIFVGNDLQFEGYTGDVPGKQVVDGLMASGDVGYIDDDGRLFVAGRDDDMIVSGGENVFPKEVEDLLAGRDDVREVAVIGADDEDFGQRLVAFVVAHKDATIDPDEVKEYVKQHLAVFSVPRAVHLIDELPRNPTGKVIPRELTAMID